MKQRALENERRAIDDARRLVCEILSLIPFRSPSHPPSPPPPRSVDEKAQQLKAISHLSALIAGFAMVVIVEIQIDDDLNPVLLCIFGFTTATVVGCMLVSMLNCTMMLVAILRYNCVLREVPFQDFWKMRCEEVRRIYCANIYVRIYMCEYYANINLHEIK